MSEYLSPGVYIEEVEMGAKPIVGVSTSTVGFVGKGLNVKIGSTVISDLKASQSFKDDNASKTVLDELESKILIAKAKADVDALVTNFEKLNIKNDATDKTKTQKYLNIIKGQITKAGVIIENLNKPTFISSWAEYKAKFGINSDAKDISSEGYLAPAVYSFFLNGGSRCYVVATAGVDKTNIIGGNNNGVRTGLHCFEEVDEVSIICAPGIVAKEVQLKMIQHCESMKDRFAIFDSKAGEKLEDIKTRKNSLVSDDGYGALYYPWVEMSAEVESSDGKIILKNMFTPPSGAVAGIYARSDNEVGVHKAPANEIVSGVLSLERNITKAEQDILNPLNINCIRAFQGMGIRVWGARTISPDPLWMYVNIRRLFIFLEKSIEQSTQWVVFEPNNEQLWARVVQTINNFLIGVWQSGALMGKTPEEAFFVKCDKTTMTADDINNGRLVVNIGVAPTRPAEFVIFRIAQLTASSNS